MNSSQQLLSSYTTYSYLERTARPARHAEASNKQHGTAGPTPAPIAGPTPAPITPSIVQINPNRQGRHFNFFLGGQIFFIFQCHRTIEKLEKQHFICSNLTLFIVPFFFFLSFSLFSFTFFFFLSFFLFFFFLGGDAPPPQMTPLQTGPIDNYSVSGQQGSQVWLSDTRSTQPRWDTHFLSLIVNNIAEICV